MGRARPDMNGMTRTDLTIVVCHVLMSSASRSRSYHAIISITAIVVWTAPPIAPSHGSFYGSPRTTTHEYIR